MNYNHDFSKETTLEHIMALWQGTVNKFIVEGSPTPAHTIRVHHSSAKTNHLALCAGGIRKTPS